MEKSTTKHYYDTFVDAKNKAELREKVLAAIDAIPEHEQSSFRIIGSYKTVADAKSKEQEVESKPRKNTK